MSARTSLNHPNPFQQLPINVSVNGDNVIVAGIAGKQIKVYRMKWVCSAGVTITIKDGASTVLDGPMAFSANEGAVLDWPGYDGPAWYTTSPGNSLIMNLSVGVQVGGNLDFIQS